MLRRRDDKKSRKLENKISNQSPLAKALAGKKAGDIVEYEAPSGTIRVQIIRKEK